MNDMKIAIENELQIGATEKFKCFSAEFENNIDFLEDFSKLIQYSGRLILFTTEKGTYLFTTGLLNNSVQTLSV